MATWVTFFNIMAYDIHGAWDDEAGSSTDMLYITNATEYMLGLGISPSKMVLGLAAYGRSTKLILDDCDKVGCPISGVGITGCPGEPGFLPYFEIIQKYVKTGKYDSLITNYTSGSMQMVTSDGDGNKYFTSFDSTETFNIKYHYAFAQCMRGIMW